MSTDSRQPVRSLSNSPSLRHLRHEAKDLHRTGVTESWADALRVVARNYGFTSWPQLKAHVESLTNADQLKRAITENDLDTVITMMTGDPMLHHAPIGYDNNGPLTWAAECRGTTEIDERLKIVRWMIDNGSDVQQGNDSPLMRAALADERIPVMAVLVEHGANVNAMWNSDYPIIYAPCETLAAGALNWLLRNGVDTIAGEIEMSCVRSLLSTYWRDPAGKAGCLQIFTDTGFEFPETAPMAVHRGRLDLLEACVAREPVTLNKRWPERAFFPFDIKPGSGLHGVPLAGATLLHMAIEFQELAIARWLIDHGADINARSTIDDDGFGGHTPLFHTIVTPALKTDSLARLLLQHGADPNLRATFRRLRATSGEQNERPEEYHNATVLDFAGKFANQNYINESALVAIREHGRE